MQEQPQQGSQQPAMQQHTTIREEMNEKPPDYREQEYEVNMHLYQAAFYKLLEMNNRNFSLTKAVYTVEGAFLRYHLPYDSFVKMIQAKVALCKQIMKAENLDTADNLAKNYAIQKLFSEGEKVFDERTRKFQPVTPFRYDFDDFFGEKDWTKMFVSKLLLTGKGQCHNMPQLYQLIANGLHATAWISTAPQHLFIKFPAQDGTIYNFEPTRGAVVSDQAAVMSGYITPTAIKNKIYLDTLNNQQLLALMMADLAQGYWEKTKQYDQLMEMMVNDMLLIDPNNISGMMLKAKIASFRFEAEANKQGRPPLAEFPKYPELNRLYQQRNELYEKIDNTGYQDMPKEAYRQWLESLAKEKQKQESQRLQEQINRMLKLQKSIKLPKSTLINSKKD